jgi:hypothetical protein
MAPMWPSPPFETPPTPATSTKASGVGSGTYAIGEGVAGVVIRRGGFLPPLVIVMGKSACGRRNDMFFCLSKTPGLTKIFGVCEIEIAGVEIRTLSATHLVDLPHQGSPLLFSCPSTSALLLRNVAHIPRWGGALENRHTCDKCNTRSYIECYKPPFAVEETLTELDELWSKDIRETKNRAHHECGSSAS